MTVLHDFRKEDFGYIDVNVHILSSTPGSRGSWWEPAYGSEEEFEVKGFGIEGWEDIEEKPQLKIGDEIQVELECILYGSEEEEETPEAVYKGVLTITNIEYNKGDIYLTVEGPSDVLVGSLPLQSFAGQE